MNIIYKLLRKSIVLYVITALCIGICGGCTNNTRNENKGEGPEWKTIQKIGRMKLQYAKQFSVDNYEGGYRFITIADQNRYLVVPENKPVPRGLDEDVQVIQLPLGHVYLAASSVMDFFRKINGLDCIQMTGTKPEDWSILEIKEKVSKGEIQYAGKYSTPDYEMIVDEQCDLAIESTMIYHSPEVKEQLERMGIATLVDYSSYEDGPLGRVEWIRLYGLLGGKEQEADDFMKQCEKEYQSVVSNVRTKQKNRKKTVAFFYMNTAGNAVVRKPGDYITKMIDIAGGKYVFTDILDEKENAMSTVNMQMETFYEKAVDADILIYNSTIDGEIETIHQMIEKNSLLADFKAVKTGNVWCTTKNMYQEVTGTSEMIQNFYEVFDGGGKDTTYIHKLQK